MVERARDGRAWRIGTEAEVAWITDGTSRGRAITSAIPPVFEAYATVVFPTTVEAWDRYARAILTLLSEQSTDQRWWLGYLDTGAHDIVFPDAPKVMMYAGWHYVLVEAGPAQAATWRRGGPWPGPLPNVLFPADHSWLVSTLWDDDWTCVGGPLELISRFACHPDLEARLVALGEDATPPGHQAL
ncbi:MAG: hypothetical protein ABSE52_05980 [Candidatus Dormibacteria bacterium]|jgi:hypothetical protein